MADVILSASALTNLQRLRDFLVEVDPEAADQTIELIITALDVLERHPLMGRPAESDLHELVISRGKTGYMALYRYEEALDRVLVLSIRHQREAGYI